ncbi:Glucooligosaccharide oxidase [Xylariaceae sp. FL1651]|nr:Glucooligosaccharide oxidase [Xylariaceae sp. FL1651]
MDTSIVELFQTLHIQIKTPLEPDWELFSSTYNARVPVNPEIVILPETIEQVAQAVLCASSFGLKVQARSGGHSYASHSSGGANGSAVIDLRKFQDVVLCNDEIVRVGGGVRLGKLALGIYQQGKRALAHGTNPTVGVGGHFTHGGYGFSSRAWGLAMDQIVALDVVLANGRIVKASEAENKELFYTMRGAADSFAIAVHFHLRTQPAPESVIVWSIDVPEAMRSVENAIEAFEHVQNFALSANIVDRHLSFVMFLAHQRFSIEGTYLGDLEFFAATILPKLLLRFPHKGATKVKFRQADWLTSLQLAAGNTDLEVGANHAEHHVFFAKSATVSHPGLSQEALKGYFEYIMREGTSAPVGYFIGVQLYGGEDSQITAQAAEDSFGHRHAMWVFQHYGFVEDEARFPDGGIQFVQGLNMALGCGHGACNNYADPSLGPEEAQKLYYGDKLGRLQLLKGRLDPRNVFAHPQSVRKT